MKVRRTTFARRRSTIALPGLTRIKNAVKGLVVGAAIFVMLAFGVNLIAKYIMSGPHTGVAEKNAPEKIRAAAAPKAEKKEVRQAEEKKERRPFRFTLFARPVYFMVRDNFYMVYSNGKTVIVDSNIDKASLPIITGVRPEENRPAHAAAFKKALSVKPAYLKDIAEVNISDPENIILLSVDGARILAGNYIDSDKMENLHLAVKHRGGKYKSADLRFKDRVIIK